MAVMQISLAHNFRLASQSSQLFHSHTLPMIIHIINTMVSTALMIASTNTIQDLVFLQFARKVQPNPQVTAYIKERTPCTMRQTGRLLSRLSHLSRCLIPIYVGVEIQTRYTVSHIANFCYIFISRNSAYQQIRRYKDVKVVQLRESTVSTKKRSTSIANLNSPIAKYTIAAAIHSNIVQTVAIHDVSVTIYVAS